MYLLKDLFKYDDTISQYMLDIMKCVRSTANILDSGGINVMMGEGGTHNFVDGGGQVLMG